MRKKLGVLALIGVLAAGVIGVCTMPRTEASAGWIETEDVQGTLNNKEWLLDKNVTVSKGKVTFAKDSARDARYLSRTKIYADFEGSVYNISAKLSVTELTEGKRFGIGLGFDRLSYVVGDVNTTYIYVEKSDSGYVAGVCSYDANKNVTEHLSKKVALSGSAWTFTIVGSYPNNVSVTIDKTKIFEGAVATEDISGYYGFMETGASNDSQYCVATVSSVEVDNSYYGRPENVNINDDFSDDFLNASVWSLYDNASYLKGVAVKEGQLRFIDCNQSSVTTQYEYSNFEMTYDIPFIQREALYNADGTLKTAACNWFGVISGIKATDATAVLGADQIISNNSSACFLSFKGNYDGVGGTLGGSYVLFGPASGRTQYALPDEYDIWNLKNEGRTLNVAFSCLDGVYSLGIKWDNETEYYHVFTVEYELQNGYISFLGYGSGITNDVIKANFALDNIKITNRDYLGNILTGIEKESNNIIEDNGDYGYTDTKLPSQLLQDGTDFDEEGAVKTNSGCSGAMDIGGIAIGALVCLVAMKKRRSEK